jgi:uncharacterized protein YecA (UPF0149 family)
MFFEHADARLNELASLYKAMETPVVTPETEKHSNPAKTRKIGRNDPCPCGSGLKYKHCCLNRGNNVLLS